MEEVERSMEVEKRRSEMKDDVEEVEVDIEVGIIWGRDEVGEVGNGLIVSRGRREVRRR